jgi:uracil phosphoribosyltransferase
MAYELSKELHYKSVEIQTPLGIKTQLKLLIN